MPADDLANLYALRARLLSVPEVARSEGSIGCEPAGDGKSTAFVRAEGSFVDDGFVAGLEVVPVGFARDEPAVATSVSPLRLVVDGRRDADPPLAVRALWSGFPPDRAWEGEHFEPTEGRWYAEEDYVPGPERVVGIGGPVKTVEFDFVYVVKLYTVAGKSAAGPYVVSRAVLNHFPPGLALGLPSGDVIRVRGDAAPRRGQLTVRENSSRAVITITVNLRLRTTSTS